jgi:hypothetical protein
MRVNQNHPANYPVLLSLCGRRRRTPKTTARQDLRNPDHAYLHAGSHPDVVQHVWDTLGAALPADGCCTVGGCPVLLQPSSGVILAVCYGTTYALRVPIEAVGKAAAAGCVQRCAWSAGPATDLRKEFGPDWVFGRCLRREISWCRAVYERFSPPAP